MPREYPGAIGKPVKVRAIVGNARKNTSLQITIPAWIVRRTGLQAGDQVTPTIDTNGVITINRT